MQILEINREDLCDFRMLGDGNIGRVYTADYTGSKDGRTFTACVAVKAIIEKASNQQIQDFVREAETRANFKHENVIALLGDFFFSFFFFFYIFLSRVPSRSLDP